MEQQFKNTYEGAKADFEINLMHDFKIKGESCSSISFEDVKHVETNYEPSLRVYKHSPYSLNICLYDFCGITELGGGVKRNMIGSAKLNKAQCESLIEKLTILKDKLEVE